MFKICLVFIKDTLNIYLHDINYCFITALPLFTLTNLANINRNIGVFIFLNMAPPQNLVFAPGAPIQINMVSPTCFWLNERVKVNVFTSNIMVLHHKMFQTVKIKSK